MRMLSGLLSPVSLVVVTWSVVFSVKVSGAGACGLLVVVTERAGLAVSQLTSSCQGWNDPD